MSKMKKGKKPTPQQESRRLDLECKKRQQKYERFVRSIQKFEPLEKAKSWLEYISRDIEHWGDEEAVIYLVSRGYDCVLQINQIIRFWKRAAKNRIKELAKGEIIEHLETGEQETSGQMSIVEASNVSKHSRVFLPNFWRPCRDERELSIDATMLRTVEWCQITGFDEWWRRFADETTPDLIHGGGETDSLACYLFNMCRSNYAIELMGDALLNCLVKVETPQFGGRDEYPWKIFNERVLYDKTGPPFLESIAYAGQLIFSSGRLRGIDYQSNIINHAMEFLFKHQGDNGAWPWWTDLAEPSIESTAIALHALGVIQAKGWQRAATDARDWLLSVQDSDGCWNEAPDPVYLTVLVLDAIELANGGSKTTFVFNETGHIGSSTAEMSMNSAFNKRFKVALSFPGEYRDYVEKIAKNLARKIAKEDIFYDKFHEAKLARLNLDSYLQKIYHDDSDLIVVFLRKDYERKEWCGLEWRAIRDLIKKRREEDIMPLRFDETEIPGLFSIDGYIDLKNRKSEEIANLIYERVQIKRNKHAKSG